jgi:hypothetical protein
MLHDIFSVRTVVPSSNDDNKKDFLVLCRGHHDVWMLHKLKKEKMGLCCVEPPVI